MSKTRQRPEISRRHFMPNRVAGVAIAVPALVFAAVIGLAAQAPAQPPAVTNEAWTRPFPPLRIVGKPLLRGHV